MRGAWMAILPAIGMLSSGACSKKEPAARPDASTTVTPRGTPAPIASPIPGSSVVDGRVTPTLTRNPPPRTGGPVQLDRLRAPPGFSVRLFAGDVPNARSLVVAPDGTVFVSTRKLDKVYALRDVDGDHRADERFVVAEGLDTPNGIAFRDGALFIAEVDRVLRIDNVMATLGSAATPAVVTTRFPSDRAHGWKYIAFGPDGMLYVPVGAPCNVCERDEPIYASITRMSVDGSKLEIFAHGVRNSVGFDWHPRTKELWFTDNGRDALGDDVPPDELNHAPRAGLHFGFPYCHGGYVRDPEHGTKRTCGDLRPPARRLDAHAAALGMRFYSGTMFPSEYREQIFVAEHGSWNRSKKSGYRVVLVRLEDDKAVAYEPFISGWLDKASDIPWGRPVDVAMAPDGALLVSDDYAGAVYRVVYDHAR